MSNQYFQFKQFRIEQEKCAMKVTTDACIQGAWTPILPNVKHVLDIGTGTGLLALMLAQRNPEIIIDAIELDKNAATQAQENVAASAWSHRVNILAADVLDYTFAKKYDLVISNPPFFNNSLLSGQSNKDMARHTNALCYEGLIKVIADNLAKDGYASILLPYLQFRDFEKLAEEHNFEGYNKLFVSHRPGSLPKRVISLFTQNETATKEEHKLVIQGNNELYSDAFIGLLSPYYLDL